MKIFIMPILALAFMSSGALASQDQDVVGPCEEIIESRCVQCHYATRICQKLGKKNTRKWAGTIKKMKKHGAKLTQAEEKTLLQCLSKPENEMQEFCQRP